VIRHYCGRDALPAIWGGMRKKGRVIRLIGGRDALPCDPRWHAKRKVIRLIGGRDALPRDPGWHVQ